MFTDIALKNAVGHVIPLEQMYRFVMFRCVDVLILMCACVDRCRFLCVDVQMMMFRCLDGQDINPSQIQTHKNDFH